MRPKLEDVAKRADVSKTTVSRVLNNRGYLSQKTIDKVYTAIKELNYQPNIIARQLYNKKTQIIGLLFPTVANPFFGELIDALEKKLYLEGFKVLVGNSMNDKEKETHYLNQLLAEQVDGLIVGTHNQGIKQYCNEQLPIVAIDRVMNDDIPVIASDNYGGGILATKTLIQQGAKKILHTNGPLNLETPARRRRLAYEHVMQQNHLTPKTFTLDFNISYQEKNKLFHDLLTEHHDLEAIFTSNDVDAILIMNIAKQLGRKIPEDLFLIGYDGTSFMRNTFPDLSTIVQPIEQIATVAIDVLKERLAKERTKKEYILPITFWQGKTS